MFGAIGIDKRMLFANLKKTFNINNEDSPLEIMTVITY